MNENRNYVIFGLLTFAILIVWQYLVIEPMQKTLPGAPQETASTAQQAPTAPAAAATPPASRSDALAAQGPRLKIENSRVGGSLRLTGARIDDLQLHGYRETIDPSSPEIVLLAPTGTAHPYYAEFGWVAASGVTAAMPDETTPWQASAETLRPGSPVTLTWDNGQGLIFTRVISLDENYMFTVRDRVENKTGTSIALHPYALVSRHGIPPTEQFWILHEGLLGVFNATLKEVDYSELRDGPAISETSNGGWLGITDKYWMAAVAPQPGTAIRAKFSRQAPNGGLEIFQTDYLGENALSIAPGQSSEAVHHFFAGAKIVSIIDAYAEPSSLGIERFDLAIDWGWFFIITKPMFVALDWLYKLFGNFGVAILLFTVFVKGLFFLPANWSYEAMTKMKKVQPDMVRIRDQYKDDAVEQQKHLLDLYRREKINPVMGCLPMLIQIPVFFSLYKVLFVTIEMRHAPFFGWVQDLSAPDPTSLFNLFGLIPIALPQFLHIGVWPLIMGVTMWLQTKLNPPAPDPVQQRMFALMPFIFTLMLASFPSGLVIYWAWNNLLSIAQQYVIMRRMGVEVNLAENFKLPGWARDLLRRPGGTGPSSPP
ncbi:MAG: membrane protein insertase YidC [Alphaproteobacteria bacterium]|nr:membrane protein insertase YidC [Alphaproteobacteria bacterium]